MATEPASASDLGNSALHRSSPGRTFAAIFLSFLLIIAIAAASVGYGTREHLKSVLRDEVARNLTQKAQMFANRVAADRTHAMDVIASQEGQAAGARATIIDTNGNVVADSEVPVGSLQHEGRQPEFATALRGAVGIETRSRNTAEVLFVAVPVSGGAVRLSSPLSDPAELASEVQKRIFMGCLVSVLLALVVSAVLSRIVSR